MKVLNHKERSRCKMKSGILHERLINVLIPAVLLLFLCFFMYGKVRTLASLKESNNYPFYRMSYYGDYGFDAFLKKGVENDHDFMNYIKDRGLMYSYSDSDKELNIACTGFSAENELGHRIFGNNEDAGKAPVLLLYTHPRSGYSSLSLVNLSYIWEDEKSSLFNFMKNRVMLLASPYIPMNGMNEHGVAITALSVPEADPGTDDGKITINTTSVIRLVLDHAGSVDEAVTLVKKYNIYFSSSIPVHYFIADSTGKSAIIEFINKNVIINNNSRKWQVVTNYTVTGTDDELGKITCDRFKIASEMLEERNGQVTETDAMNILKATSVDRTLYSCIFNLSTKEAVIVTGREFDHKLDIKLNENR